MEAMEFGLGNTIVFANQFSANMNTQSIQKKTNIITNHITDNEKTYARYTLLSNTLLKEKN